MEREKGYYWVKDHLHNWFIMYWNEGWLLFPWENSGIFKGDSAFVEINEKRILNPDEDLLK